MLQPQQVEELIHLVCTMDRPTLTRQLTGFDARFPIDFTPEFMASQPIDRLRHIFVALCLHCQKMPALEQIEHEAAAA
jgi:hypothetical protein